jgi:peptidoglycan/xylan/chitin deacetylase (PgdA/CDA1 family)
VSLSFDDARPSQLDVGLPILDRHGVKATFYVSPSGLEERAADWRRAERNGHEIGNHTCNHPCTGNYQFSRGKALENYTLDMIADEIDRETALIERLIGITPVTFAYPCGQKFVGRGRDSRSYVPLIADRFMVGRGWLGESSNDPAFMDPAQVLAMELDGRTFEQMKSLADQAAAEGRWLVFCGHDIGPAARQTVTATELDRFCRYAVDPANGIWIGNIRDVATYILTTRGDGEIR